MQLNVYVPRSQEGVVERLDRAAERLGRNKNEVVLEAIEEKVTALEHVLKSEAPEFKSFDIGAGDFERDQLYSERLPT